MSTTLTKFTLKMTAEIDANNVSDAMCLVGQYMIDSADNPEASAPKGGRLFNLDVVKQPAKKRKKA